MLRILTSTYCVVAELVGAESSTIDKGILLAWSINLPKRRQNNRPGQKLTGWTGRVAPEAGEGWSASPRQRRGQVGRVRAKPGEGRSCDAPFGVSLAVAVFSPVSAPLGGPLLRPDPFTARNSLGDGLGGEGSAQGARCATLAKRAGRRLATQRSPSLPAAERLQLRETGA